MCKFILPVIAKMFKELLKKINFYLYFWFSHRFNQFIPQPTSRVLYASAKKEAPVRVIFFFFFFFSRLNKTKMVSNRYSFFCFAGVGFGGGGGESLIQELKCRLNMRKVLEYQSLKC